MKKAFFSLLILASLTTTAQNSKDSLFKADTTYDLSAFKTTSWEYYVQDSATAFNSVSLYYEPSEYMFELVRKNKTILNIKRTGEVYVMPSAFCDCYKCKTHKGMKFLYNINKTN